MELPAPVVLNPGAVYPFSAVRQSPPNVPSGIYWLTVIVEHNGVVREVGAGSIEFR